MVQRPGQDFDTGPRDPSECGFQTCHTAHRRRDPYGATGIAPERHGHHPRSHRRAGASARTSREAARVPRVGGGCAVHTAGQLVGCGLADHHRPGLPELGDHGRIGCSGPVGVGGRPAARRQPGHVDDVLDTHGDTCEWTRAPFPNGAGRRRPRRPPRPRPGPPARTHSVDRLPGRSRPACSGSARPKWWSRPSAVGLRRQSILAASALPPSRLEGGRIIHRPDLE